MTILSKCACLALLALPSAAFAAEPEKLRVEGRVTKDEAGVAGVVVLIHELSVTDVTGPEGWFHFDHVPLGTYSLVLTLGDNTATHALIVSGEGPVEVAYAVDWDVGVHEQVTVTAAARAAKIVDAPAAVTSIPEEQIEQQAAQGQVPKILEFTPGAEVTQSGLYDFNFNTRGFNSSLNRRVSTYVDGRDVGVVLLGAQEWASIAGGLDDVANLEFVRGPSAALYGANASSGVVNITTKAPRDSLGTFVRVTAGELDTTGVDFRRADSLGAGWYSKVLAGFKDSGDFSISRNPYGADNVEGTADDLATPEYSEFCMEPLIGRSDCLPREKSLFREQDDEIRYGALRFDKYLSDKTLLTFEAGIADIAGPVFQTGIGRVQNLGSQRPFYRFNFTNRHWNVLVHYSNRDGNQANLTKALVVNYELITDDTRYGVEAQGNWTLGRDKVRIVAGAAHTQERVDTEDPDTGLQTVVYEPLETNRQAVFGQVDWRASPHFKLVFAGRVDESTLHDPQFSPKVALVYSINSENSLRATYNEAFQVANYSEFFLHARISAFPIGGFVRTICEGPALPQPVDCGIEGDFIPILAVGNDDLELEETQAWEVGYSGVLGKKVFVTLDYYNANNENFITDLIPQFGTIPGVTDGCMDLWGVYALPQTDPKECPVNADYLQWVGPDEAENTILVPSPPAPRPLTVATALRNAVANSVSGSALGFRLAEDLNGDPIIVGRTYTNVGAVDTQGIDLGIQYFLTRAWNLQASYSWFDFEILDADAEVEGILLPNSPTHKASLAVSWANQRWAASIAGRWVQGFPWSAGVFQGDVDDYSTVDVAGSYQVTKRMRLGANVANARDSVHRQTFGGDLLSRRALVYVTYAW